MVVSPSVFVIDTSASGEIVVESLSALLPGTGIGDPCGGGHGGRVGDGSRDRCDDVGGDGEGRAAADCEIDDGGDVAGAARSTAPRAGDGRAGPADVLELRRDRVDHGSADDRRRSGIGDHDRVRDRLAGQRVGERVGLRDRQVGRRDEAVRVAGAVVDRVRVGDAGRRGDRCAVDEQAGGTRRDVGVDRDRDRAADRNVDEDVHVAGPVRDGAAGTRGGHTGPGPVEEFSREAVGDLGTRPRRRGPRWLR